ncbi:stage II sporulation protein M [Myxococcus sp. CA051A]|uniref:Stage II sporulation protein M n=1 Tax=Myxococcus llanfairpwllgwyngyllgogerychwyrndrobwllllantysiliogogogochensis TaxID=2590453 RepID=A0A540WKV1_9BACT|nr:MULTISPECIES: stage II sporulation protein M [Myxococcus]NTX03510.1 stage II sporulation protein M [Myxococcus sp. CA040A]NTX14328.1 stage II sporulation protein M [Myxococcus sp. CA056]NTX41304.1 stage II sporulation protein M [Myxococcus sp. CA033]NTX54007.1 stage II sporulation protein M [Myxococcus sp. CA039A]NTX67153.1 stage II sporulation protein M [Myxococcus sp. CA051A]
MAVALPAFVASHRGSWDSLEALLTRQREGTLTLEELRTLDTLYRRAASDLAHAQTFYPGTDAHRFLNQLCARAYAAIYQPPRERWASVRAFFRREFPQTLRRELRYVGASAALFILGLLLGALVVLWEPRGAELLVPAGVRQYVAQGRMWTDDILSVAPPNSVSSGIATNNLTVTILTFAMGLFYGLGTVFILVNNGVQIGAIAALCAREGMLGRLMDFISAHGPVELSVIVIAGGAGLMVGQSLIDPGELPRGQALALRGREAVKLVLGCAPFLALIGVVEGYVSPGDLFPTWAKAALGLALGGLFWGYLLRAGSAEAETVPEVRAS